MSDGGFIPSTPSCDRCGERWPPFMMTLDVDGCPNCNQREWKAIGPA